MKLRLYSALFIGLMLPFSVFSDADTAQEDKPESIGQPVSPTTGDIEGTVYLQDTKVNSLINILDLPSKTSYVVIIPNKWEIVSPKCLWNNLCGHFELSYVKRTETSNSFDRYFSFQITFCLKLCTFFSRIRVTIEK